MKNNKNKYAIYAYTHGPVTGSGPSVVTPLLPPLCSYSQLVELASPWPGELAKGPSLPPPSSLLLPTPSSSLIQPM